MQIKTKIVSCHTADSKQVNGTVILPPLVFPGLVDEMSMATKKESFIIWTIRTSTPPSSPPKLWMNSRWAELLKLGPFCKDIVAKKLVV